MMPRAHTHTPSLISTTRSIIVTSSTMARINKAGWLVHYKYGVRLCFHQRRQRPRFFFLVGERALATRTRGTRVLLPMLTFSRPNCYPSFLFLPPYTPARRVRKNFVEKPLAGNTITRMRLPSSLNEMSHCGSSRQPASRLLQCMGGILRRDRT